jgi:putative ABC transport system substrate-binding protein
VTNLARPGGNITGFQNFEIAIGGKWLELLKEIAPEVRRVGVIYNQHASANVAILHTVEAASGSVGTTVAAIELHEAAAIEPALTAFAREPNGGLIVMPNPLNTTHRDVITGSAARFRLPAVYPFSLFVASGGLVLYGFDTIEQQLGAATYVDRVLKGEKPANLPVQAPTKYQLLINLKTAKALSLTVPRSLLARADEVIE